MKVITKLQKSPKLLLYESLSRRNNLSTKEKNTYLNLKKGYEGELFFSNLTEKLPGEGFIFNDLLLEYNQTTFQLDCLIINQANIYLYEVKNFNGDFYLEADKFYKKPRHEMLNPLHQLSRAESLFRQLLLSLGFNTPIAASVAFVNPTFTLYQTPLDIPVIFPNQIDRHLTFVSNQSTHLTANMKKLATNLLEVKKTDYPFEKPQYEYEQLKKGLLCAACGAQSIAVFKRICVCEACGHRESNTDTVLRSVKEFQLLFPDRKITTTNIYDWCGGMLSKKIIWRILSTNLKSIGINKSRYYE